jgi:thiamine kinase-like enzyme
LIDYHIPAGPGLAFLRESVVPGRSPADRGETMRLAGPIAEALARLHRGIGVAEYRLSKVVRGPFAERWRRFAADRDLSGALARRIADLIERDGDVAVSLCHGDLVASNILLTDQADAGAALSRPGTGFVLIDWEHARPGPIAFDLAKLHLAARHPDRALRAMRLALRDTFGCSSPTTSYQLEEQFALAHARMLTWHEHRRARAVAASRLEQLEADTRRRLAVLEDLLS